MTVVIDSVTTGDAAPTTAPHRISAQATKNQATVAFTPSGGSGQVRAWRVTIGNRKTGKNLGSLGVVCGIDRVNAPGARLLSCGRGVQRTEVITFTEMSPNSDGDYGIEVNVYADSGLL